MTGSTSGATPALLLGALLLGAPAVAQSPALDHSAPKLGSDLTLTLEGAPPSAAVRLYFSVDRGSQSTPFGTLELDRGHAVFLAGGFTDASGAWQHVEAIPLDASLAETWGHYQALVETPGNPAGWTLSQGAHLRYVGTRLYVSSWGDTEAPGTPAQLGVLSAIDDSRLGTVPLALVPLDPPWEAMSFGKQWLDGHPVFSADLAWGAIVAARDRLVLFDNFTFEVRAILPLQGAAGTLLAGADGRSVIVLEAGTPARLLSVDLETAAVTSGPALPWPVQPVWAETVPGSEAWVVEEPGDATSLRRLQLSSLSPGNAVGIGTRDIRELRASQGLLFAITSLFGPAEADELWVVDVSTASAPVASWDEFGTTLIRATPLPRMGLFLVSSALKFAPSEHQLLAGLLPDLFTLRPMIPPPLWNDANYSAIEPDSEGFWALDSCCGYDGGAARLLQFDDASKTWKQFTKPRWSTTIALDLEVVEDGLVDRVYFTTLGCSPCIVLPPLLHGFEPASGDTGSLIVGWRPYALSSIQVP